MENYQNYIECANNIKQHLKHEWQYLEEKLDYLKGESKTYDTLNKGRKTHLSAVYKSAYNVVKSGAIENTESIYVDNLFADLFENYFGILKKLDELEKANLLDYNSVFESAYTLIANMRALIKSADAFVGVFCSPITCPDGVRIKDDRVEITLSSIKNLYQEKNDGKEKSYRPFLYLRAFGFPAFCVAVLSMVAVISVVLVLFASFYAQSRQIVYLQQESMEAYNKALKQLTTDFFVAVNTNVIFMIAKTLMYLGFLSALLYLIIGKIVFKKLNQKTDLTVEEKFYFAFMFIDKGIFTFKYNLEKHKILIIECAEEGSADANVRLGNMYEKGLFQKGKFRKADKQDLKEALSCYKRAFPDKRAVKMYNKLEKKLAGN